MEDTESFFEVPKEIHKYFKRIATMVYVIPNEKLSVQKMKQKEEDRNIYHSLKFFVIISQILAVLPQENITTNLKDMHFRWKSWKVLYTLIMFLVALFALICCLISWFYIGYEFAALANLVFYASTLVTIILYLRLAQSWCELINAWCKMDKIMNPTYGYPINLDKKLKKLSIIFFTLGIADFFLSVWNRYEIVRMKWGNHYDYTRYYIESFPQLFSIVSVNRASILYCSILNVHCTLIWVFNDVFIILMSTILAMRFQQITERLSANFRRDKRDNFWVEIREDYERLSIICKELDDQISYIVLLSFSLNIFFLLVQLYHSLEAVNGVVEKIYFAYSFLYLIIKVVSVSLYAAWINDESLEPASILNSVNSSSYNIEVRRFLIQIGFDNVALTGCRMFKITRGIILSIAGAVVTYELVLIQFNNATDSK